jgi:hypothetical protein
MATLHIEPEKWARVHSQLRTGEEQFGRSRTEVEFQGVGLTCREALITLAQAVHDPERHPSTMPGGKTIGDADAEERLGAYFDVALPGDGSRYARAFAKTAVALANHTVHKRTADFKAAALALTSMRALVQVLAILEDVRSGPARKAHSATTVNGVEQDCRSITNWIFATRKRMSEKQVRLTQGGRIASGLNSQHNFIEMPPALTFWPKKDGAHTSIDELSRFAMKVNAADLLHPTSLGASINELDALTLKLNEQIGHLSEEYGFPPPE